MAPFERALKRMAAKATRPSRQAIHYASRIATATPRPCRAYRHKAHRQQSGIPIRGGLAKNDTMLRWMCLPKRQVPSGAGVCPSPSEGAARSGNLVAFKTRPNGRRLMKVCILLFMHPNDLVRVTLKKEAHLVTTQAVIVLTGAINLWSHDRNKRVRQGRHN